MSRRRSKMSQKIEISQDELAQILNIASTSLYLLNLTVSLAERLRPLGFSVPAVEDLEDLEERLKNLKDKG
jgi:hypothetical protein